MNEGVATPTRRRKARPWMDYALRLVACIVMAAVGYLLLSQSTFILRMRNDVPAFVPGLDGPHSIGLVLAVALSLMPLLAGRRFLGGLMVSAFILSGIGAYWWTLIPWDELITESDFPVTTPPVFGDYVLIALPAVVIAMYVVASRASRLLADAKNRGIDRHEAMKAAAMSYLAGVGSLVAALVGATALWVAMSSGALTTGIRGLPTGMPALLAAAALVVLAWAIGGRKLSWRTLRARQVKVPGAAQLARGKQRAADADFP